MTRLTAACILCFWLLSGCGNSQEVDACIHEYISDTTLSDWSDKDHSDWDEEKKAKYHYLYAEAHCQDEYPDE